VAAAHPLLHSFTTLWKFSKALFIFFSFAGLPFLVTPAICNKSDTAFKGKIKPRPFYKNPETISEANQKQDMHKAPDQPSEKAAEFEAANIGYGFSSPNGGHGTFIGIMERGATR
jgi:hypothetical protein